ncbi:cytochrome b [Primorskyibacter flagellatus]|uniref:cytochrome b n=1 Tax=Primorskyibacter flagellatus TaxID=1387277 RepID=UPI001F272877|nr:cytochrome b/b6 domain-containing protein [Primorskyibacter flagellatus]
MELSPYAWRHALPAVPATQRLEAGEYASVPAHAGLNGRPATVGHVAIYALMVIVPAVGLDAEAVDIRGLIYLGIEIFPPRETRTAFMRASEEWHATLGWIFGLLVLGDIAMAVGWHHLIKRDCSLERMSG